MKKIVFLLCMFFLLVSCVDAKKGDFVKTSEKVFHVDLNADYVEYESSIIFTDDSDIFSVFPYYEDSSGKAFTLHMSNKHNFMKKQESIRDSFLSSQLIADNIISIIKKKDDNKTYFPSVVLYDRNYNELKSIDLPKNYFKDGMGVRYYIGEYYISRKASNYLILGLDDEQYFNSSECFVAEIDFNSGEYKEVECTSEVLDEHFSDVIEEKEYEYNNFKNKNYHRLEKYTVVLDNSKTVNFYENEEKKFTLELDTKIENFKLVKLLNDRLIVVKENNILFSDNASFAGGNYIYYNGGIAYYSEILIYDFDGNLLQSIDGNASYLAIDVQQDKNQFVLLKRYVDGLCSYSYLDNLSCDTYLSHVVYEVDSRGVLGDNDSDEKNDLIMDDNDNDDIVSPDTHDIAITTFILLLIISLVILVKFRKINF